MVSIVDVTEIKLEFAPIEPPRVVRCSFARMVRDFFVAAKRAELLECASEGFCCVPNRETAFSERSVWMVISGHEGSMTSISRF